MRSAKKPGGNTLANSKPTSTSVRFGATTNAPSRKWRSSKLQARIAVTDDIAHAATADILLIATPAQNLREAYLTRLAAHRDALRQVCVRLGWGLSLHRTDSSVAETLLALRMRLSAPEIGAAYGSA